ncbi:WD40 repeat-like protein [Aspergillus heteromorphus CBS 117.55]|uniref:WD40 repeat-like protein n=1 Tax=Aspergillus heteromorphus CBS 117.55 TaxID=1448321 RepID=A0A317W0N3_9EURO|nr:WD40 repeat-like protein [Aspergillus heteromorphus CBS 117.55]PWY79545.1 WD40 repeat-like protein [Aspergillus heteromorphus CBS 117.55]
MSRRFKAQDSEDLSLMEEAEVLLSQFMRQSSRDTQESPTENDSNPDSSSDKYPVSRFLPKKNVKRHARLPGSHTESRSLSNANGKHQTTSILSSKQSHRDQQSIPVSSLRDTREIAGARRSSRAKSGPVNYYDKANYLGFDCDEEAVDNRTDISPVISQQIQSPSNTPSFQFSPRHQDRKKNSRVIYSSPSVQILKSSYQSIGDFEDLRHACYSPGYTPAEYARKYQCGSPPADNILHIDFDREELKAVLNLFSFYGYKLPENMDMSLSDQIIHSASIHNAPQKISKRIWRICELAKLLPQESSGDINMWILKVMASDSNEWCMRRAKRLMKKVWGINKNKNQQSQSFSSDDQLQKLSAALQFALTLNRRGFTDIDAFIADARRGCLASSHHIIQATVLDGRSAEAQNSLNGLLQRRELGRQTNQRLRSSINEGFKLAKTWKGASNDMIVLAWSPDGTKFAAGATAQCDEHNMEYNRNNNLVVGDLVDNSLAELPDHWLPRPSGRAAASQTVNDYRLWMSVTSIEWWGDALFTASYDNTVKLWDSLGNRMSCFKTLRHDSKVEVMARSNFEGNLLATGTHSIGLWGIAESSYGPLEMPRSRSRKDIELVPTSLAWGVINATGNILLAGMSEKDDGVPQTGLLAGWHIGEASATPMQFSPNSQNMFDIKWHPTIPIFAAATSLGHGLTNKNSKDTRSLVRLYQPLSSRACTMEFECPALDINDVNICPMNPNYVTASCTDGITYVWDHRRSDNILHKLKHGEPLNQVDETISRDQADVGVRIALWGDRIDEFYTGASDGILKRWDILKAPDDVLVQETAKFEEEIMCGAFSKDKTNLLIGDAAGGIHVLSSGPFSNTGSLSMEFKSAPRPPRPRYLETNEYSSDSGIGAGSELLLSGKLIRHPVYGVGQGPYYDGPFAAWARPENTSRDEIARTCLKEEVQLRQLEGTIPEFRIGLDTESREDVRAQIKLANIRNGRPHQRKRESEMLAELESNDRAINMNPVGERSSLLPFLSHRPKRRIGEMPKASGLTYIGSEMIDSTGDTDADEDFSSTGNTHLAESRKTLQELEEELEEDFWWPHSGTIDANIQDVDSI